MGGELSAGILNGNNSFAKSRNLDNGDGVGQYDGVWGNLSCLDVVAVELFDVIVR